MTFFPRVAAAGLLAAGSAMASCRPAAAEAFVVAAVATDVQAVVLRDAQGQLRRLGTGESLAPGSAWRLLRIELDRAVFAYEPQHTQKLQLDAGPGESVDFSTVEARLAQQDRARWQASPKALVPVSSPRKP